MESIGVRELRQNASEYLRRVETGETFEVTDRGRPVAVLGPVQSRSMLERMRVSGELIPAPGGGFPVPADLGAGEEPLSETLARMRADER